MSNTTNAQMISNIAPVFKPWFSVSYDTSHASQLAKLAVAGYARRKASEMQGVQFDKKRLTDIACKQMDLLVPLLNKKRTVSTTVVGVMTPLWPMLREISRCKVNESGQTLRIRLGGSESNERPLVFDEESAPIMDPGTGHVLTLIEELGIESGISTTEFELGASDGNINVLRATADWDDAGNCVVFHDGTLNSMQVTLVATLNIQGPCKGESHYRKVAMTPVFSDGAYLLDRSIFG